MARNRNGEVYVVCNYNPAGNFLGSFTDNVLPPGGCSPSKRTSLSANRQTQSAAEEIAWQQEALLVHNEYRRRHRVSDLRLSPELTSAAKVNSCTWDSGVTAKELNCQRLEAYTNNISIYVYTYIIWGDRHYVKMSFTHYLYVSSLRHFDSLVVTRILKRVGIVGI